MLRRNYNVKFRRNSTPPSNTYTSTGAGIVPFKIEKNKLFFLLGKERYISNWRGSLCWSGFEGGNKDSESCEENACREFSEETLCIFGRNFTSLQTSLQNSALKIWFTFARNNISRNHVTYLKHIDSQSSCDAQTLFGQTRGYISEIHSLSLCFQKSLATITNEYPLLTEGHILHENGIRYTINRVNSVEITGKLLLVELHVHSENHAAVKFVKYACKTPPVSYLQWFNSRKKLQKLLSTPPNELCVDHPSITVTRKNDLITNITVNADYLEKVEIKWWSLSELRHAVYEHQNIFRPYFVPIIKTIIDEFSDNT